MQFVHCYALPLTTPERFLPYPRKSGCGTSIPTWLSARGKVYMKRHVKANKYEDGKEATVSLRHLAPQNGANDDLVRGGATPNIPYVTNADGTWKNGNDLVNNPDEIGDDISNHGNDEC